MRYLYCLVFSGLLLGSAVANPVDPRPLANDPDSTVAQGAHVTQLDLVRASQILDLPQRLEILEGFLQRPIKDELHPVLYRMIVDACKEMGDIEAATFYGEEALRFYPSDGPVLLELTELYAMTPDSDVERGILYAGRAMEALKSAARAMGEGGEERLGAFFGALQRDWGWLEFRRGDVDEAERMLAEASEKRKEPETFLRLGLVRKSAGKTERAVDDLAMALALSSGNNKAAAEAMQEIISAEGGGQAEIDAIVKKKRSEIARRKKEAMVEQSRLKPQPAPSFTVTTLDGDPVSLEDLKGSVVVLDFWATWCGPCRRELPMIQKVYESMQDEPVVFLAISTDADTSLVRPYLQKNGLTLPVAFGRAAARSYGISSIPMLAVVDGAGMLRFMHTGYHPDLADVLPEEIKELLQEL